MHLPTTFNNINGYTKEDIMAKEKVKKERKLWFRGLKQIMRIRYKRPTFVYLDGKEFQNGAIILSNHEGTDAPLSLEIYCPAPLRMWGAHEMNSGLKAMYKYQSRVYYHEKKHWNLHLARLFCLIACPLTNLFYKGLNLISTYNDSRLRNTLRESCEAIKKGEDVVIFPEDSTEGYLEELKGFHKGFLLLAETCLKQGIDVPIYVTYFNKKERTYIIDKPVLYSTLKEECATREEISDRLLKRCNELGKMKFNAGVCTETVEESELQDEEELEESILYS